MSLNVLWKDIFNNCIILHCKDILYLIIVIWTFTLFPLSAGITILMYKSFIASLIFFSYKRFLEVELLGKQVWIFLWFLIDLAKLFSKKSHLFDTSLCGPFEGPAAHPSHHRMNTPSPRWLTVWTPHVLMATFLPGGWARTRTQGSLLHALLLCS